MDIDKNIKVKTNNNPIPTFTLLLTSEPVPFLEGLNTHSIILNLKPSVRNIRDLQVV
jgi:hypothetical protein